MKDRAMQRAIEAGFQPVGDYWVYQVGTKWVVSPQEAGKGSILLFEDQDEAYSFAKVGNG